MNSRAVLFGGSALLLSLAGFVLWWILDRGQEWKSLSVGSPKVNHVCWSPKGDALIAAAGKRVLAYAHPAWTQLNSVELEADVSAMLPTESGILVGLDKGSLLLLDPANLATIKSWPSTPVGVVHSLALSSSGTELALGGDKGIALLNRVHHSLGALLPTASKKVHALAWASPVSLVFVSSDTRLRILSLADGEITESKKLGTALEVVVADGKGRIVTANKNGGVTMWKRNVESAETSRDTGGGSIEALSSSPQTKWIAAVGQDQRLHLCDFTAPDALLSLRGHKARIHSVAIHPQGEWIATGAADGTIKLWKAPQ